MPRKKVEKLTRPSGIETSANGKYFYWKCTVSGLETFADEARFKDVVAKYGNEKKLFDTYVIRSAQKYVDAGYSAERIKGIIAANDGKLPAIDAKEKAHKKAIKEAKGPRKKRLKSFAVGEVETVVPTETGSVQVVEKVYPWTNDPNYFVSGGHRAVNIEEDSRLVCFFPNVRLDDLCYNCPIFDRCNCNCKVKLEDRKLAKYKPEEIKITHVNSWGV